MDRSFSLQQDKIMKHSSILWHIVVKYESICCCPPTKPALKKFIEWYSKIAHTVYYCLNGNFNDRFDYKFPM